LRHAWEQIAVKCPACQWTGNLGSYQAHFSRGSSTITGVNEVDQLRERCKILEESLEKERSQVRLLTDSLAKECSKSFDLKLNLEDANMKKSQAETRAHCLKGEIEKAERRLIVTRQGSQILLSRMQREVLKARQPSIDKKTFPVVRSNTTADSLTDT
jgi:predicted nuclease with TOPRIM domain